MKKKNKERLKLYFQITGVMSFILLIGKMGDLQLDKITATQAIVHGIVAILYIAIAYSAYQILGNCNEN